MTSSSILHANYVIWLICKLGSKTKIFMQITKRSTYYVVRIKFLFFFFSFSRNQIVILTVFVCVGVSAIGVSLHPYLNKDTLIEPLSA